MNTLRTICGLGALLLMAWTEVSHALPVYGVSAYVATDAGGAHDFVNFPYDTTANVATTGVITQALSDNAYFGAQSAAISAYATIGALGGKAQAFSASGSSPSSAQTFADLNWYFNWIPKGTPGSKVQVQFSQLFEGVVTANGRSQALTTTRASTSKFGVFNDLQFSSLSPGPFSILVSKIYEFDVGELVVLGSRMTIAARAELDGSGYVDAFNSSKFYIDMLTPGTSYNVEDYRFPTLTPIPEPSALFLMSAGMASIGLFPPCRRRLKRKSSALLAPSA